MNLGARHVHCFDFRGMLIIFLVKLTWDYQSISVYCAYCSLLAVIGW